MGIPPLRSLAGSAICTLTYNARGVTRGIVRAEGRPPVFYNEGKVTIGTYFVLRSRYVRSELGARKNATLTIGDHCGINQGVSLVASNRIEIGDYALIGDLASFYDTDHHPIEEGVDVRTAPIILGRNVWIGRGVTVLPGVTIGDFSVIAAGSVVAKSIESRTLAGGNPAKEIRKIKASDDWIRI